MFDLYYAPTSNSRRVSVMLEECGLPYEKHRLELGKPKPAAVLAVNPLGALPVLIDRAGPGGQPLGLSQSQAMMIYLAEKTGRFLPASGVARAKVLEALMLVATDLGPSSSALFYSTMELPKEEAPKKLFEGRLVSFCTHLNAHLADHEFIGGELSIADLALVPIWAGRKALLDPYGLKHLDRWGQTMTARSGVQRGLALT